MSFSAEKSLGERGYEKTRFAPLHFSLEEIKYRFDKDIEPISPIQLYSIKVSRQ